MEEGLDRRPVLEFPIRYSGFLVFSICHPQPLLLFSLFNPFNRKKKGSSSARFSVFFLELNKIIRFFLSK